MSNTQWLGAHRVRQLHWFQYHRVGIWAFTCGPEQAQQQLCMRNESTYRALWLHTMTTLYAPTTFLIKYDVDWKKEEIVRLNGSETEERKKWIRRAQMMEAESIQEWFNYSNETYITKEKDPKKNRSFFTLQQRSELNMLHILFYCIPYSKSCRRNPLTIIGHEKFIIFSRNSTVWPRTGMSSRITLLNNKCIRKREETDSLHANDAIITLPAAT